MCSVHCPPQRGSGSALHRAQRRQPVLQKAVQPQQPLGGGPGSRQIDQEQKGPYRGGKAPPGRAFDHALDQHMVHQKHRVGEFGRFRAQRPRPGAVQPAWPPTPQGKQPLRSTQRRPVCCRPRRTAAPPAAHSTASTAFALAGRRKNCMPTKTPAGGWPPAWRPTRPDAPAGRRPAPPPRSASGSAQARAATAGTGGTKTGCCPKTIRPHRQNPRRPNRRPRQKLSRPSTVNSSVGVLAAA